MLARLTADLTDALRSDNWVPTADEFESKVRAMLTVLCLTFDFCCDANQHPYAFPDITVEEFGVEVKYSRQDSWRSVANSIFETHKSLTARQIYVVFAKVGGVPEVRFRAYEESVIHVRTSHVPRFEVDLATKESLFTKFGIPYQAFSDLGQAEKMEYVRAYARSRLGPGERLWWLDEDPEGHLAEASHTLPLSVRMYTTLKAQEKRRLRAEAALLCPSVVGPSRMRGKYDDATLYLLTYHGVLCNQARDLFSAGSVALRTDDTRGGIYVIRALNDLSEELIAAASYLPDTLFAEYWGETPEASQRLMRWLTKADEFARDWRPSLELSHLVGGV